MGGLDPTDKSARLANYLIALRKDLLALAHACGEQHPALVLPRSLRHPRRTRDARGDARSSGTARAGGCPAKRTARRCASGSTGA
jgi:hypothetical protein